MRLIKILSIPLFLASIFSCGGHKSKSVTSHTVSTPAESTAPLTADQVLTNLKAGNENFVKAIASANYSHGETYNYHDQLGHTKTEQHPTAFILSCIDSRVPPEIIFDQGIGAIFVDRVAGNVVDEFNLGSMEYAVDVKHVKLVVVLGHLNCGAVTAAFGKLDSSSENLVRLIGNIKENVIASDTPPYDASAKHNVAITIKNILDNSKSIRAKADAGEVKIIGAVYDVATGKVEWDTGNW